MNVRLALAGLAAALRGFSVAVGSRTVRRTYLQLVLALLSATLVLYVAGGWGVMHFTESQDSNVWLLVLRVAAFLVVLVASPVLALFLVNVCAPLVAERVFIAGMQCVRPSLAQELDAADGLPLFVSAKIGLRRLGRFLFLSSLVFFLGFVPFVGSVLAPPLQFFLTARTIGNELMDPLLSRRHVQYDDQVTWLRSNRSALMGFAAPYTLVLVVPFLGPLLFGLAQAAAAVVVTDVIEPEPETAAGDSE